MPNKLVDGNTIEYDTDLSRFDAEYKDGIEPKSYVMLAKDIGQHKPVPVTKVYKGTIWTGQYRTTSLYGHALLTAYRAMTHAHHKDILIQVDD